MPATNHLKRFESLIQNSPYISRDLSWMQFNYRVLDQAYKDSRTVFEKMKFLAITASNLDEFFMVRVGSLYNYIDFNKSRTDYSGLREDQFRDTLYAEIHDFYDKQKELYNTKLAPYFEENGFKIAKGSDLNAAELDAVSAYFKKAIFPMLTPMVYDSYHAFPLLQNKLNIFAIVTREEEDKTNRKKLSFVQIPKNIPRFYTIEREDHLVFVPIEEIIRENMSQLFRNVTIDSVDLFRITRNGDFTLEESEDMETDFIEEIKLKLKTRRTGRVVRVEVEEGATEMVMNLLAEKWDIDETNFFHIGTLIDYTALWQIIKHRNFKYLSPKFPNPVQPLTLKDRNEEDSVFDVLKKRDVFLHYPYNSPEFLMDLVEKAADDPKVLAIKMTIYRLADDSRFIQALHKALENGKHVSALFELKARFDEENNIRQAQKLQKAGGFVIHGISSLKTHTKLMLIVRKEGNKVTRYVHMASGNYNEDTSRLYTDIGLITTNSKYGEDVSEFFNAITGHSKPKGYNVLLTAPENMRKKLIDLINQEAKNAKAGQASGIVVKVNSLQDDKFIDALYRASQAGVKINLIVRGICCIRPGREGLSENITVRSLVGDYLEHSRVFYFHNNGNPVVYGGSADAMVRSFERRIESMFSIQDEACKLETINLLHYNLKDNVNAYQMNEDGSYDKVKRVEGEPRFNSMEEFFKLTKKNLKKAQLF
ncbi:polyphosphate kinase 1 [Sediminitomix flava]|uniref:Polyphosphate kinase n=1 Tax=Sediminitomix flava TaxID=379075 RepID=A0A315ZUX0_SEDFL|nr:polyphosphate kinase 1 [Sediminitomix flava]PWJ39979.1 polyphosphate kinase [Sediminitomix flava]